jgi:O-antigen ligase
MKFIRKPAVKVIGQRPPKNPLWPNREAFFSDAGLFCLGAAGIFSVNVVGSLPGNEVLIFPMLPVILLARGRRAFNREYFWFYALTAGWLLGTLIADLVVGSPTQVRLKGIARVVFFMLDFTALAVLMNNKVRRLVIFALSIAFIMYMASRPFRGDFSEQWKFGISQALATVALWPSCYFYARKRYGICLAISIALAAVNLRYGFRSQLLVVMVSAVLVIPIFRQEGSTVVQNRLKLLALLAFAGGAAWLSNASVQWAAQKGFFDESTREKFETQSHGDLGVLVGGRPETLVAIQAIIDRPILGHGSFPYEPKYMQLKQDIQYEHGYTDTDEPDESVVPVIPTHSHLTMAWVESGILGGICWIYIMILVVRSLLYLSTARPNMAPLYGYFMVSFIWDILYSPFGSVNRMIGAFYILLAYGILRDAASEAARARRKRLEFFALRRSRTQIPAIAPSVS